MKPEWRIVCDPFCCLELVIETDPIAKAKQIKTEVKENADHQRRKAPSRSRKGMHHHPQEDYRGRGY
jgi:hypothetical protein